MAADRNGRLALRLGAVVAAMLALSFAAVPFYNWFCRVTGYAGTTQIATSPDVTPVAQTITVRFDANTDPDMPWQFRPKQRTMELHLGETGMALYEAYNPTDRPVAGQASFNVAPFSAGGYFDKIACFCFELQVLQPGERVDMPVTFYVDPAILEEPDAQGVTEITLSYTMHQAPLPEDVLASAAGAPDTVATAGAPDTAATASGQTTTN